MQTYSILLFGFSHLLAINQSSDTNCDCTQWICDGYDSASDEYTYEYNRCVQRDPLWIDSEQCTFCIYCSSNITICSCNTELNCNGGSTINTSQSNRTPAFWWISAVCCGGFLLFIFLCSIVVYISKSLKEDQETDLATMQQNNRISVHHKTIAEEMHKQDPDEFEVYLSDHDEPGSVSVSINTDSSWTNDAKKSTNALKIVIGSPRASAQVIPHYKAIFKHKKYKNIDIYTKYLVVGYTRNTKHISVDTAHINKGIYYVMKYLHDNCVSFDTYTKGKDFLMSSTPLLYGIHEWTLEITKPCIKTQEIGIVSILHKNFKLGPRRLSGEDLSLCCIQEFGARTVYGRDSASFYYGSYNDSNFERCKIYLNELHKYDRWVEGDRIKCVLNLIEWSISFYLKGKRIGKRVKIQKNKIYYPIVSYYGRFRCRVVEYK